MSQPDEPGVVVSPWVVVMAIRYGLGHPTHRIHNEAINLIRQYFPSLRRHWVRLVQDLEVAADENPPLRESCEETVAWIEEQVARHDDDNLDGHR